VSLRQLSHRSEHRFEALDFTRKSVVARAQIQCIKVQASDAAFDPFQRFCRNQDRPVPNRLPRELIGSVSVIRDERGVHSDAPSSSKVSCSGPANTPSDMMRPQID
jgi:hypothetical protein